MTGHSLLSEGIAELGQTAQQLLWWWWRTWQYQARARSRGRRFDARQSDARMAGGSGWCGPGRRKNWVGGAAPPYLRARKAAAALMVKPLPGSAFACFRCPAHEQCTPPAGSGPIEQSRDTASAA